MSEMCKAYTGAGTKVFLLSGPQIVNARGNHGGALKNKGTNTESSNDKQCDAVPLLINPKYLRWEGDTGTWVYIRSENSPC